MPFTRAVVGTIPACTPVDVRIAVTRAREVIREWAKVPPRERAEYLLRLHDLVIEHQKELLDRVQLETGKARRDALEELLDVLNTLRYYALTGPVLLAPRRRRGAIPGLTRATESYRPHGVIGMILPWNYLFTLAISELAPALLAGNAVVIKPAEKTVEGALRGCFSNTGQLCVATERLYVQDGIFDSFVSEFIRRTKELRLGAAFDYRFDVGSLISWEQLDKCTSHVEEAVARGATVLAGGMAWPDIGPYFFKPTILTGVRPDMHAYAEETSGPVVSVFRFRRLEEALTAINASKYGLNGSI